jgi:hypothetical protein
VNREDAITKAVADVCAGTIADYGQGLIDRERLEKDIRRRKPLIAAYVQEMLEIAERGPVMCCKCQLPATTVVARLPYCETHAAVAPRQVAS